MYLMGSYSGNGDVFWRCCDRMSAGTPAILAEHFSCSSAALQENARLVPLVVNWYFQSKSWQCHKIIHKKPPWVVHTRNPNVGCSEAVFQDYCLRQLDKTICPVGTRANKRVVDILTRNAMRLDEQAAMYCAIGCRVSKSKPYEGLQRLH
jgi:hypothetical protein